MKNINETNDDIIFSVAHNESWKPENVLKEAQKIEIEKRENEKKNSKVK